MTHRGDLLFYGTGGTEPPIEPGVDQTVAMVGAVSGSMAGAPMVGVEGVVPPRLRATLHRRPNLIPVVAELSDSYRRQWQEEMNLPGSASMTIGNESDQATQVREGDVVRFEDEGFAVFAWIVREINRAQIAPSEEIDQVTDYSGDGLLSIFKEAVVYPSNGLGAKPIEEDRYFSWQDGAYDDSWWGPAARYPADYWPGVNDSPDGMPPNSGMFAGVTDWANVFPGCPRITAPDTTYWLAPGGWSYMRRNVYIGPDDPTQEMIVYWFADDAAYVWWDGQPQGQTEYWSNDNSDLQQFQVEITPGWHVIAVAVQNHEGEAFWSEGFGEWINPWSLVMAGFPMDPATYEIGGAPIFWSDAAQWKMVAYPPGPPGWTPGQVILRLMVEAQWTRSGLAGVTAGFNEQVDSAGQPWPNVGDIATKVGTDYLTFLLELCETYVDIWMEPAQFRLHAWVKGTRGQARPVTLHPPLDVNNPMSGNLAGLSYKRVD